MAFYLAIWHSTRYSIWHWFPADILSGIPFGIWHSIWSFYPAFCLALSLTHSIRHSIWHPALLTAM